MKRFLLIVAVLTASGMSGVQAANDEPSFRSGSDGLPAGTLAGHWTKVNDKTYQLDIAGGHVQGTRTWFEASWVSPWTTKGEMAEFNLSYDFSAANAGNKLEFKSQYRFQARGEAWSPWHKHPAMPYEDTLSFWGGGSGFGSTGSPLRFDWRATGSVKDPSLLKGWIEVSIN